MRGLAPWDGSCYRLAMAANSESGKTKTATTGKSASSRVGQFQERLRREVGPVARSASKQIGKAFRATAKAAEKTSKIVSLRTQVAARELRVKGLFLKIGEAYYLSQKAGKSLEENAASLNPLTEQVDKLKSEISSLKQQEKKIQTAK